MFLSRQINLANDAICTLDEKARITSWNQGAEKLYEFTPEEALGKYPHELLRTEISKQEVERGYHDLKEYDCWVAEVKQKSKSGREI